MTSRHRHFLQGGLFVLLGVLLFVGLFYGLRAMLYDGGPDEDENLIAFGVGLGSFIVCAILGAFFVTLGLTKPADEA